MVISFIRAVFTLYIYSYTQHGQPYSGLFNYSSGNINEFTNMFLHWAPLNLCILKAELFVCYFDSL
jgi:NADH-ubiquinone oxidoreductase chain 4